MDLVGSESVKRFARQRCAVEDDDDMLTTSPRHFLRKKKELKILKRYDLKTTLACAKHNFTFR